MTEFLHTRLCDLLGIRYPIIQAPMGWTTGPQLVAAVSNAGGLGVLANQLAQAEGTVAKPGYELPSAAEWDSDPVEWERKAIRQVKSLTDKPFGVFSRDVPAFMEMVVDEGVQVVVNSGRHPGPMAEFYKGHGVKVIHMGSTVKHARTCQKLGVDAFIMAGYEGGGHDPGGNENITTFVGVPQCVDAVDIPVIACGGIGDGRGIVAALSLGAEGIRIGTRFLATEEAANHRNHKMAVVAASDTGTVRRGVRWGDILRSVKNPFVDQLYEMETSGAPIEEIASYLGDGSTTNEALHAYALQRRIRGEVHGDLENGEVHAGQVAGLIKEILPAAEVIRRMVAEAEEIMAGLAQRLQGRVGAQT